MNAANKLGNIAFAGVLLIIALFIVKSFLVTTAPTPAMFAQGLTLEQAIEKSAEKDGVVLAVVTADWCGACQRYKHNGLSDERVAQWISVHGEPVYLNADKDKETAAELGAQSVPTTVFIHDGKPLGAIAGAMSGDILLTFLERGLAEAESIDTAPAEPDPAG
ncbi:MAG: thioredoxin family protein [Phycisphaeraceae bacterium]|nr:thioredoxin family protein [Phycisphaeraceae bacterium]MCB9847083.1 thioredoxin family protein [Phycisphaeraceae bacterium]